MTYIHHKNRFKSVTINSIQIRVKSQVKVICKVYRVYSLIHIEMIWTGHGLVNRFDCDTSSWPLGTFNINRWWRGGASSSPAHLWSRSAAGRSAVPSRPSSVSQRFPAEPSPGRRWQCSWLLSSRPDLAPQPAASWWYHWPSRQRHMCHSPKHMSATASEWNHSHTFISSSDRDFTVDSSFFICSSLLPAFSSTESWTWQKNKHQTVGQQHTTSQWKTSFLVVKVYTLKQQMEFELTVDLKLHYWHK